jgi:hypothetical protein
MKGMRSVNQFRPSHEAQVLLGRGPLERGQVLERGDGDRRGIDVEFYKGLCHREGARLQAAQGVPGS